MDFTQAAGVDLEIFALRPPADTHFQDKIARVRAPVTYLRKPAQGRKNPALMTLTPNSATYFGSELVEAAKVLPGFWQKLERAAGERSSVVYQAAWLAQEVRQRGITHLHAHFGSVATSVARLAAQFAEVPYSFTAHAKNIFHDSVEPEDLHRKLRDAAVITMSDYNVRHLQQQFGSDADGVQRIYNGMDLTDLQWVAPVARSPQPSSDVPPRILSVCRLVEKKGVADLIDACALLRQWGCRFVCQIVGTGPLEADLRSHLQALHLNNWVEILGPRPQQEVFALMHQATVFAAPYVIGADGNRDGLPTVLLEAMALGTPCVATDVTGIPEVIRPGETGLLVNQRDAHGLAVALQQVLMEPDLCGAIARQARTLIETEFDIARNVAQLRSHFSLPATAPKKALLQDTTVLQEV
ncbi:MAG: glycosyltransferase family 4 protein [Leptolyngbyaceae cyanobacterium T60_A2020_046]|nr:glycosyltransferase family 4 protein [Leptolyngbyaceae cyanobacterium T60_A2020_046]